MNAEKLYDVITKRDNDIKNALEIKNFVDDFFNANLEIPVVIGHNRIARTKDNMIINQMSAIDQRSKLTILNYMEFLNEIIENKVPDVTGHVWYNSIEDTKRYRHNSRIITISSICYEKNYDLKISFYNKNPHHKEIGYQAKSSFKDNEFEEIARRYVGPNKYFKR